MLPRDDGRAVLVEPLAAITLTTGNLAAARRFYQGALGMSPQFHRVEGEAAMRLAAHWGLPAQADYEYVRLCRPGLEGASIPRSPPSVRLSTRASMDRWVSATRCATSRPATLSSRR